MAIYDIFSKIKNKPQKEKIKSRIIIDIHEKNSLVYSELIASEEIEKEVRALKVGDYIIGEMCIERKTFQDFVSSMLSKRIFPQLKNLLSYKKRMLIIEGKQGLSNTSINPNSIRGFILSIINNYEIPVLITENYSDTANYLITLTKQQIKKKQENSLHSRIPKTLKEQKEYVLESFPNIGPSTAKKLLEKYSTLSKVFSQTKEELEKDIGKKSEEFKRILEN